MHIYSAALFGLGAASAIICWWVWRMSDAKLPHWEKLPRNRILGTTLGGLCLIWCIPHTQPILPNHYHSYLLPLAILLTWLAYMYLDFVMARATGGFLILLAHFLLAESFARHTLLLPVYSVLFFVLGTIGIIFSGKPYLMRDLIRKLSQESRWRKSAAAIALLYAAMGLIAGFYHLRNGG